MTSVISLAFSPLWPEKQQYRIRIFMTIAVQSLFNAMFGVHRNRLNSVITINGTILQRNHRKMTMKWSFSYDSFVEFHGIKNLEPNDFVICFIVNRHRAVPVQCYVWGP